MRAPRAPRPQLVVALLLTLAAPLLAMLPAVGAAPALLRPNAWFDQPPALIHAHVATCGDVGAAGARMVGCKVQLGTQPEECVYLPEKAKALVFMGLRKSRSSGAGPGSPEFLQLESFPSGRNGWVYVKRGAGNTCTEVLEPRKEKNKAPGPVRGLLSSLTAHLIASFRSPAALVCEGLQEPTR